MLHVLPLAAHASFFLLGWFMWGVFVTATDPRLQLLSEVTAVCAGRAGLSANDLRLCTYTRLLKRPGEPADSLPGPFAGTLDEAQDPSKAYLQKRHMLWPIPYIDSAQQT